MKLSELKQYLVKYPNQTFKIQLPDGHKVPQCFHITEVGKVHKTFIDCGGTLRELVTCQLQVWVGEDIDHRLEAGKMLKILEKASTFLTDPSLPVEMEYEDRVLSQYTIEKAAITSEGIIFHLMHKHTACLAPELCILPQNMGSKINLCCGSSECC